MYNSYSRDYRRSFSLFRLKGCRKSLFLMRKIRGMVAIFLSILYRRNRGCGFDSPVWCSCYNESRTPYRGAAFVLRPMEFVYILFLHGTPISNVCDRPVHCSSALYFLISQANAAPFVWVSMIAFRPVGLVSFRTLADKDTDSARSYLFPTLVVQDNVGFRKQFAFQIALASFSEGETRGSRLMRVDVQCE